MAIRGAFVSLVAFVLVATACSGGSTEPDVSPAANPTAVSSTSTPPLPVATAADTPLEPPPTVPGWAVEAQFSSFMTAASEPFGCDFVFDRSQGPPAQSIVVTDFAGRELRSVERGMAISMCLNGFGGGTPIVVTLTESAGRQERLQRIADAAGQARISRIVEVDHPLGTWTVRAEQDDHIAETSLQVVEPKTPRVVVVPMSYLADFLIAYPMVAPGESHYVLFVGFESGEQLVARLYSGLSNSASYDQQIDVRMDAAGSALVEIATRPADRDTWFCLALEPDIERRLFADYDPAQYGRIYCLDNPFTTEFATAAVDAIFCDGLRCVDYFDEEALNPDLWRVTGVAPDDPDGGLNVRSEPRQSTDSIRAVLRWDASALMVENRQGTWWAVSMDGWADDAYLEPDLASSCPPGLMALRVVGVAVDDPKGGLVVTSRPGGDVTAVYRWNTVGICGAENRHPTGVRQVLVQGWAASEFLSQS